MFFHFNDLPHGLQDFPGEGWPMFAAAPELDPAPVRVGGFNAPQVFHSTIMPTGPDGRPLDDWVLTLLFGVDVEDQQILLSGAIAGGLELTDALDTVRKARPLRWWQRRALVSVVADVAERAAAFVFYEGEEPWNVEPDQATHTEARAWELNQTRAAQGQPLGQRRNRVTHDLLKQVAETYRRAWDAGTAPTQAVADQFGRPHSTAARWVARARREGLLGPADGSRGGEIR